VSFNVVREFEAKIAKIFNAPYAVATDCCTHAIEACLIYKHCTEIKIPVHTYVSVPFLSNKLNISLTWTDEKWKEMYHVASNIYDAAALWKPGSYIKNTLMCLSFQYTKPLGIGRGGCILTDNRRDYDALQKLCYDGRSPGISWFDQDIDSVGYHYYMCPDAAKTGIDKLSNPIENRIPCWEDYIDCTTLTVFS